ncbi:MAG TPA: glucose-6-phosphate dehydrogenase [Balneolales bacterium]|nr:glucose-6-phosphate dehydrogenase [Balneolales bacterium]
MQSARQPEPAVIIIFGAGGDLTWRKIMPALFNLYLDDWLPDEYSIIGLDIKEFSDDQFRDHLLDGINQFSRQGKANPEKWKKFAAQISYTKADFTDQEVYNNLQKKVKNLEKTWDKDSNRIFYMAIPPKFIQPIAEKIGESDIAKDPKKSRIVVEKPFGHDLESASELNNKLTRIFDERQIYRIDHYLGKETVQNILALRFANALFEPIWNRNYIDHVQITVGEQVGVEHRGSYYDHAGALRDMIQNHLLQLLCLIAMEPPVSFEADEVRNKKVDVLHAIRKYTREEVPNNTVRGQYGQGWIQGNKVTGYRNEPGVDDHSNIETFAAVKFFIDNWRWQDVPFYVRTGKRLPEKISVITIQFRPVPHQSFPVESNENWQPNRLVLTIQPHKGIRLRFQAKRPGIKMILNPVDMQFNYSDAYITEPPEAYETLLLDVMLGDATLFMRADQVEAAWSILMPIINVWEDNSPHDFPNYAAGTWGPEEAEALIARDANNWIMMPTLNTSEQES